LRKRCLGFGTHRPRRLLSSLRQLTTTLLHRIQRLQKHLLLTVGLCLRSTKSRTPAYQYRCRCPRICRWIPAFSVSLLHKRQTLDDENDECDR
uniref:Mitochondrial import inner membrane translocase subunit Tim23 n=1 Tax=Parascaris univalens TaxID=6257 RepID=A0A915BQ67_PARUN